MNASLQRNRSAHTVLIRMARDEARAQRIRDLKLADGRTWPQIAEAVPIGTRSMAAWAATGALSHQNCVRLAAVFGVDPGWLWLGPKSATPDLMAALPNRAHERSQLDRIEEAVVEHGDLLRQLVEGLAGAAALSPEELRAHLERGLADLDQAEDRARRGTTRSPGGKDPPDEAAVSGDA